MIPARRIVPRATLTRRPLPEHDPSIEELSAEERRIAATIWHGRAEAELRASGSFQFVATEIAAGDLRALALRAVVDERRHAQICWQVACAYAGRELPAPRKLPIAVPSLSAASAELRQVLHVVGMCCLNETTGNAFLELCRDGARAPLARAALHELACDEIDHARLGWAFLATTDTATRAQVAAWLPELIAQNLAAWRDRPRRAITDALVAHGCPRWDDVDAAVVAAISNLLVPGFAALGMAMAIPDLRG